MSTEGSKMPNTEREFDKDGNLIRTKYNGDNVEYNRSFKDGWMVTYSHTNGLEVEQEVEENEKGETIKHTKVVWKPLNKYYRYSKNMESGELVKYSDYSGNNWEITDGYEFPGYFYKVLMDQLDFLSLDFRGKRTETIVSEV